MHKRLGQSKFYNKLLKLDPISKDKIKPTDTQRTIRAYEVKLFTKKSIHQWFEDTKAVFKEKDFYKIYIDFPRQELIHKIYQRVDEMLAGGAIPEVKRFIKLKVKKDKTSNKAIGINEIKEYLNKNKNLVETKEIIAIKTRQYAKRQSTWARGHMNDWLKVKPQDLDRFIKKI